MIRPNSIRPGETQTDSEIRGLSFRCYPTGKKSWMLHYRTRTGTVRRPKLGDWPVLQLADARRIAKELLARVALGEDPAGDWKAQRRQPVVREAIDEWFTVAGSKLRSHKSIEAALKHVLSRPLARKKTSEVTSDDIEALHAAISRKAPTHANRVVAILSSVCGWMERKGYRPKGSNPCDTVRRNPERKRRRYMRADEARLIAGELDRESPLIRATIRLLMRTGARRGELAGRKLIREGNVIWLDQHKTGHGKAIRLPKAAVALIEDEKLDGVLLPGGSGVSHAWKRVCRRAGIEDLHLHDLRHTFASAGLSSGVSLGIIGNLLGHSNPRTTARYAHLVDTAAEEAAEIAANAVENMLSTA